MKKIVLSLCVFLFFVFPFWVQAEELEPAISGTKIEGMTEKKIGEILSQKFVIEVSGIEKNNEESKGILAVSFELIFDDSVFTIKNMTSSEWDSIVYQEAGKYYILSTVSENSLLENKCVDNISYCGTYSIDIDFLLNDTSLKTSEIKIGEVSVVLSDMIDFDKEYTEDDLITLTAFSDFSNVITIKKDVSEIIVEEKNENDVIETKPEIKNEDIVMNVEKKPVIKKKSSNNYLKLLEIENYEIGFDKDTLNYEIIVENGVNNLVLNVEVENNHAKYTVVGADDLTANNYQVLIGVTAEDGSKKVYTIDVKEKEKEKEVIQLKTDNKKEKEPLKKTQKMSFPIGSVLIVLVIVFVEIVVYLKSKKIKRL